MPYIITISKRKPFRDYNIEPVTRTASSDLIAARAAVQQAISDNDPNYDADLLSTVDALPAEGGTVPLPDGTVIEVREVDMVDIAREAFPRDDRSGMWPAPDKIIAAFNARQ